MAFISGYLTKLISAALISSVAVQLLGKKGSMGSLIRLLSGIFMIVAVISPWAQVRLEEVADYFEILNVNGEQIREDGEKQAFDMMCSIIKSQTEAYILDKADSYGAELAVEVSVDGSDVPVPCAVRLSGSISPAGKQSLSRMISEELGIPLEAQIWTG